MARMVTGSVAESVAPTDIASTKLMSRPSSGIRVNSHCITASTRAEMKVPAKAKVRMVPRLRKKLPCAHQPPMPFVMSSIKKEFVSLTWCNSYPLAKMMGGSSRLKKN